MDDRTSPDPYLLINTPEQNWFLTGTNIIGTMIVGG